jgi:alginate O-acetyltransferase complex protein AlgJ
MVISRWLLIGTLLLVLGLGVVSTAKLGWDSFRDGAPPLPVAAELIDGRVTSAIAKEFSREVAVRPLAINLLNAAAFYVFGEARHGVLIGEDDWLFSREEFERSAHSQANVDAALGLIQQVIETLHARDVKVAVVLLPMKADIYGKYLGRYTLPTVQRGLYAELLARVNELGADYAPDIRSMLLQQSAVEQVFLKTDTHWTVSGAGATASSLCGLVGADLTHAAIKSVAQPTVQHRGDLLNFLDLGPFASGVAVTTESITPLAAAKDAESEDALFGASDDFPITLVGTSYSANPLWSFKDQIETSCQASVLGVAVDGEGPFEPMADYLRKLGSGEFAAPQLVVWEVPIRYLDNYEASTLAQLVPDIGQP